MKLIASQLHILEKAFEQHTFEDINELRNGITAHYLDSEIETNLDEIKVVSKYNSSSWQSEYIIKASFLKKVAEKILELGEICKSGKAPARAFQKTNEGRVLYSKRSSLQLPKYCLNYEIEEIVCNYFQKHFAEVVQEIQKIKFDPLEVLDDNLLNLGFCLTSDVDGTSHHFTNGFVGLIKKERSNKVLVYGSDVTFKIHCPKVERAVDVLGYVDMFSEKANLRWYYFDRFLKDINFYEKVYYFHRQGSYWNIGATSYSKNIGKKWMQWIEDNFPKNIVSNLDWKATAPGYFKLKLGNHKFAIDLPQRALKINNDVKYFKDLNFNQKDLDNFILALINSKL